MAKGFSPEFKKQAQDDLINMETGVMGYKGKVIYEITGSINNDLREIGEKFNHRNEQIAQTALLIDKRIHSNYSIFANNRIAYDLLQGEERFKHEYSLMEKLDFESYIEKQIQKIDLINKDLDFLKKKILEMYANPLINYLQAK